MIRDYLDELLYQLKNNKYWISLFITSILCTLLTYIKSFYIEDLAFSVYYIKRALIRAIQWESQVLDFQIYASHYPKIFNIASDYILMLIILNFLFYLLLVLGAFLIGFYVTRGNFESSIGDPTSKNYVRDFEIHHIDIDNALIKYSGGSVFISYNRDFTQISILLAVLAFCLISVKDVLFLSGPTNLYNYDYPIWNVFIEAPFMAIILCTAALSGSSIIKRKLMCWTEPHHTFPSYIKAFFIVPIGGGYSFASRWGDSFDIIYSFKKKRLREIVKNPDEYIKEKN